MLLSIASYTAAALNGFKPINVDHSDDSRRQGISYSSNIIHLTGKNPEESAQSTVNVNFNLSPEKEIRQVTHHNPTFNQQYSLPKATEYFQKRKPFLQQKPKEELIQSNPQSSDNQLFNVGYTVNFANAKNQQQFQRPRVSDNSDIITGTRKGQEFVQKPQQSFTTHELSSNSLLEKQIPQNIVQTNLLPLQPKYYDTSENPYQNQQQEINEGQQNHLWHNLSPGIEIFKSTDLSEDKPVDLNDFKPSHQFDHAKALGNSEGFGYSNAINSAGGVSNQPPPQIQNVERFRQNPNSAGPVLFDNVDDVRIRKQPNLRIPTNVFLPPITHNHNLQTSASNLITHGKTQQAPKLPIDTRLLRNPVLTTKERPLENDPHSIPIHFDTSLVQEAMNKELLAQKHRVSLLHVPGKEPFYTQENVKPELFYQEPQEQLKVQRKPQPSEKRHKEDYVLRHPRQNRHYITRPDRNIQIHLRPPPMSTSHQRRVYRRTPV